MVELECADVGIESASDTAAASLRDEALLQVPSAFRHRLGVALRTAVVTERADADESTPAVDRTLTKQLRRTRIIAAGITGGLCLQSVPSQPVANRCRADVAVLRDLSDGYPVFNERDEHVERDSAPSGVTLCVSRHEPVLVHPIRDGRRRAARLTRNRLDRASLGELRGERVAIHPDTNTSSCA